MHNVHCTIYMWIEMDTSLSAMWRRYCYKSIMVSTENKTDSGLFGFLLEWKWSLFKINSFMYSAVPDTPKALGIERRHFNNLMQVLDRTESFFRTFIPQFYGSHCKSCIYQPGPVCIYWLHKLHISHEYQQHECWWIVLNLFFHNLLNCLMSNENHKIYHMTVKCTSVKIYFNELKTK